jgi:hypothetical protein
VKIFASLLSIVTTSSLIVACDVPPTPKEVSFDSSPTILRGRWQGTIKTGSKRAGEIVQLEFAPLFVDASTYRITGTARVGNDAALKFEAPVYGGNMEKYLRTQAVADENTHFQASLKGASNEAQGTLQCVNLGKYQEGFSLNRFGQPETKYLCDLGQNSASIQTMNPEQSAGLENPFVIEPVKP